MIALKALRALGPIDLKNIRRDPLLQWMVLTPLLMVALLRWLIPWLAALLLARFAFDLKPYYALIMSCINLTVPLIVGVVTGFLLLDQRDDHTLSALQVTPLSLDGYLVYRVAAPAVVTLLATVFVLQAGSLVPLSSGAAWMAALAAAPYAPMMALMYASVAQNKVQGLAVNKASGVILLPGLIAYFVPPVWQPLFGIFPTYWPLRLFWALAAGQPGAWGYLAISLLFDAILLAFFLRIFKRVMTS